MHGVDVGCLTPVRCAGDDGNEDEGSQKREQLDAAP